MNATDLDTDAPFTVNELPLDEYILSVVATEYEYVPLGRVVVIVDVVDDRDGRPVMFTYHVVPDGRPVSVNVTA